MIAVGETVGAIRRLNCYTSMCIQVYHGAVGRTNVVLDDKLMRRVMRLYGFHTKRETIDYALRQLAGRRHTQGDMLELRGIGWEGDLDEMRSAGRAFS